MFGSMILEVAIGMIFIYLLVAIMCSGIREGLEAWLKTRAAYLEYGIRELLHDKSATGLAGAFFNHPLIFSLYSGDYKRAKETEKPPVLARGRNLPSYIPPRNFALALLDMAARGPRTDVHSSGPDAPVISLENVRANIQYIGNDAVQRAMLTALDTAEGKLDKAVAGLEAWYDGAMERLGGLYRRSTHWILFWVGLVVAIALNVNSIVIADHLYRDDAARAALVARAEAAAADTTLGDSADYAKARQALDSLSLPIGWDGGLGTWSKRPTTVSGRIWYYFLNPALGWLLTALAAMLGAPFWFDMLNKVMVFRSTVKPTPRPAAPEPSPQGPASRGSGEAPEAVALATSPADRAVPPPAGAAAAVLNTPDAESDVDGCDAKIDRDTPDEELPQAKGGVA